MWRREWPLLLEVIWHEEAEDRGNTGKTGTFCKDEQWERDEKKIDMQI